MGRPKKWIESSIKDGIGSFTLSSWNYFADFITKEMLDYRVYIYRGQRHEDWMLEPTLHRMLKSDTKRIYNRKRKEHLERFRFALRGRVKDSKRYEDHDNEIWSIGQHHGLATPLLDWSTSPFVAAYFAFFEATEDNSDYRVVHAISQNAIKAIEDLEIVRPLTDENSRLITQSGLFTNVSSNLDIETQVRKQFKGNSKEFQILKIRIPNKDREMALRSLNRMNINHNTLFPDFQGASIYCNMEIEIDKY